MARFGPLLARLFAALRFSLSSRSQLGTASKLRLPVAGELHGAFRAAACTFVRRSSFLSLNCSPPLFLRSPHPLISSPIVLRTRRVLAFTRPTSLRAARAPVAGEIPPTTDSVEGAEAVGGAAVDAGAEAGVRGRGKCYGILGEEGSEGFGEFVVGSFE